MLTTDVSGGTDPWVGSTGIVGLASQPPLVTAKTKGKRILVKCLLSSTVKLLQNYSIVSVSFNTFQNYLGSKPDLLTRPGFSGLGKPVKTFKAFGKTLKATGVVP